MNHTSTANHPVSRRRAIRHAVGTLGLGALLAAADETESRAAGNAPVPPQDRLRITRLETFLVKPRWLFLRIHTNAGIVGLGEPILEGRAKTCATAVEEIAFLNGSAHALEKLVGKHRLEVFAGLLEFFILAVFGLESETRRIGRMADVFRVHG